MQWNDHSRLTGQHAFLGASKYHWLNYDAQRLADAYLNPHSCPAVNRPFVFLSVAAAFM